MNRKLYLHATGSTCYDKTGMTYPRQVMVDFVEKITEFFQAKDFRWEPIFDQEYSPAVLTFHTNLSGQELSAATEEFYDFLAEKDMGFNFLVVDHWCYYPRFDR